MFLDYPSVSTFVRACVRACSLLARYIATSGLKFALLWSMIVVEATDELVGFVLKVKGLRSRSQQGQTFK